MVSKHEKPRVIFSEFADSSLNFDLIVCVDVRANAERVVKSNLYFSIFDAFKKAGIEIPFPQRDIHVIGAEAKEGAMLTGQTTSASE
jgi:small-conductance mechanosensitive channel